MSGSNAALRRPLLAGMVLLWSSLVVGQNPQLRTKNGNRFPTLTFSYVLWTADPAYYSIAIDSTGNATYQSAPDSVEQTGVPFTIEFHVSERTRRATFNLARNLNFFSDPIQVSTGSPEEGIVRTFLYRDSHFNNQVTYSTSPDANLQELTSIFEEMSETLEWGRRLLYFHEHDKRALAVELTKMQERTVRHHFRELGALAPILNNIASDQKLDASVREQAQALLQQARAEV